MSKSDAPKLAAILMASGRSTRFGTNKLLAPFRGRPLIETVFDRFPSELFQQTVVVTRYAAVAVSASERHFSTVENPDETGDIAVTIRLGLESLAPDTQGCLFLVCDQPLLRGESIRELVEAFRANRREASRSNINADEGSHDVGAIFALSHKGSRGSPVLFPASLFEELRTLPSGRSGSALINAHPTLLRTLEVADASELLDVDVPEALEKAISLAKERNRQ